MKAPKWMKVRWRWAKQQKFEKWARLITSLYLSVFLAIVLARFTELFTLPLNELGDFAAGMFAPLAFLWLVLGYQQQGRELANSNSSLVLQATELRSLVENQRVANEIHERTLEPLFELRHIGEAVTAAGVTFIFEVINVGGYCKRLDFRMYGPGMHDGTQLLGSLPTTHTKELRVSGMKGDFVFYRFCFEYETLSGRSGVKDFVTLMYVSAEGTGFNIMSSYEMLPPDHLRKLGFI